MSVFSAGFELNNRRRRGGSTVGGAPAMLLNLLNSSSLDQRVTFSRGTNAMLTDSTGTLTYAPSNHILNSESFTNTSTWPRTTSNVTSNATVAPDGTTTADKLLADGTAGALHYIATSISGQSGVNYTYSLYVKAAELSQVSILIPAALVGATTQVTFDTATNPASVIGTVGSPLWSNITAVGNGWYRIAMAVAATATASGGVQIKLAKNGSNLFDGNSVDGLYIWGAQFGAMTYETAPRTYNSTTPKNLLGRTEEFDNAAWSKANSYVQTNLQTYSEQFDVLASWTLSNINTPTANAAIAPNGTLTADTVVPNATSTINHIMSSTVTVTIGTQYTYSMYAKAAGYDYLYLRGLGFGGNGGAVFNVSTGEMVNKNAWSTASISAVGNGWYRCVVTGTALATTPPALLISNEPTYTVPFAGDGTSGIYLWGAQLVQGATAGNYQQTLAAAVTTQYTDPNGNLTADKLVEDTTANEHYVDQQFTAISATTYTYSAYLKAGERSQAVLRFSVGTVFVGGSVQVGFILTGSGSSFPISGSPTAQSITAVGNGWYRCSISALTVPAVAATPSARIQLYNAALSTNNYTGDGTSGIYIWGAQLSDSASVDPYVYNPAAALASTAYYGPRFDYDPAFTYSTNNLIPPYTNPQNFGGTDFFRARANAALTTATADPSGGVTAYKLTEDATLANTHLIQINGTLTPAATVGTQYTYSIYAKAAERTAVVISTGVDNGTYTNNGGTVDLITGAISGTSGTPPIVTNVGNGWWRISVTATALVSAQGVVRVFLVSGGSTTYNGNNTSGIYIWGAQLTASAAAVPFYYYSRTPNPLGLLIEEARTNLISPADANAGWAASSGLVVATANAATSPDGTTNATKLATNDTAPGFHIWYKTYTGAINTTYCASVYLKAGEYTRAQVAFDNTSFAIITGALFDLAAGTVVATGGGSTATITAVGNGWYRCSVTATSVAVSGNYVIALNPVPSSVTTFNTVYTPAATGLGVYVYGVQVEAATFATSHIPTVGAAVTRSGDIATMIGNNFTNWYNQTTGTLSVTFDTSPSTNTSYVAASNGNIAQNSVHIDNDITSGFMRAVYYSATVAVATLNLGATGTVGTTNKIATAYAVNDFAASRNGGTVATGTGDLPIALTQLNIGTDDRLVSPYYTNGHIKTIAYYNTRLTNTQLQAIST